MTYQRKTTKPGNTEPATGITPSHLALHTAVGAPTASQAALDGILKLGAKPEHSLVSGEWALKEVECAREFNFELPEDLIAAVEMLEQAVQNVMGVRQCMLLVFDETTGVYTCLNDIRLPGKARELTRISDSYLQELAGTGKATIHSYLLNHNSLVGTVAVAEKEDGSGFTTQDQMMLDILAPYLANKIIRFQNLKQSLTVPYIQSVLLEMAGQLVTAVDQDAIIACVLETFTKRLGFDACQYVGFNTEAGIGEVLYEIRNTGDNKGQVQSYTHAGLEGKRRTIQHYTNLVGLLSSVARNQLYLHLNGKMLGDRSLDEIFSLEHVQAALLLPVIDMATGEIRGTFNLFQTGSGLISAESREIAKETVHLTSRALTRAMVLEKAMAMASSDELTGLINRRGYYQRFEAEIERARRHNSPLCVVLVDVDHFKKFNDTYGHLSGDLILKALADLFAQNLRKSDVVCRFGGEEFAFLLPDTNLSAAADLMERVRQNVEKMQLCGIHGERLHVTISAGLTQVDTAAGQSRSAISEALALADEQLYAAKNNGRNQVKVPD